MQRKHNKDIVPTAKMLRKNMTKEEKHLWYDFLRTHPVRFSRQKVLGKYIADFYCNQAKLVVELDGSQHCTPEEIRYDNNRTQYLQSQGLTVMRLSNLDVMRQFRNVCEAIDMEVKRKTTDFHV